MRETDVLASAGDDLADGVVLAEESGESGSEESDEKPAEPAEEPAESEPDPTSPTLAAAERSST